MKPIVAITVICFLTMATHSIDLGCVTRLSQAGSCITRLATASQSSTDSCNDCGNLLVLYYEDCTFGVGVDTVQAGMLIFV